LFYHQHNGLYLSTYRAYDPVVGRWGDPSATVTNAARFRESSAFIISNNDICYFHYNYIR